MKNIYSNNIMDIKLLSWNICFGCMYANEKSKYDGSARGIAEYCKEQKEKTGVHICLDNISDYIIKYNYDFICLQEATNWLDIYNNLSQTKYGYIHHKQETMVKEAYADLVTLYNKERFEIHYAKVGDIGSIVGDLGRPYHILFFSEKGTNNQYIIINVHMPHHIDQDTIYHKLSDLTGTVDLSKNDNHRDVDENVNKIDINSFIMKNRLNFNVIIMGDFNDHGKYDYWKGITPFQNLMLGPEPNSLNNVILRSDKQPPNTCCRGKSAISDQDTNTLYGDYILIDLSKIRYKNGLKIYDYTDLINMKTYPTSDHLPISANISLLPQPIIPIQPIKTEPIFHIKKGGQLIIYRFDNKYCINNYNIDVNSHQRFIFPNGRINNELVLVGSLNNIYNIGYIRRQYLQQVGKYYKLKSDKLSILLRLQNIITDPSPNEYLNGNPFRGTVITGNDDLYFPNGEIINKNYVIVQQIDDPNVFGYVQTHMLETIMTGGTQHKIYKYKFNE
jgi:hypothetical protein